MRKRKAGYLARYRRRLPPDKAAEQVHRLLPYAGPKDLPGAAIKSMGFRILLPK